MFHIAARTKRMTSARRLREVGVVRRNELNHQHQPWPFVSLKESTVQLICGGRSDCRLTEYSSPCQAWQPEACHGLFQNYKPEPRSVMSAEAHASLRRFASVMTSALGSEIVALESWPYACGFLYHRTWKDRTLLHLSAQSPIARTSVLDCQLHPSRGRPEGPLDRQLRTANE